MAECSLTWHPRPANSGAEYHPGNHHPKQKPLANKDPERQLVDDRQQNALAQPHIEYGIYNEMSNLNKPPTTVR